MVRTTAEYTRNTANDQDVDQKLTVVIAVLGEEWLGFDVLDVLEVAEPEKICPVPTAPVFIKGITNFRGEILTIVDLNTLLYAKQVDKIENKRIIIVCKNNMKLGFIVEKVDEIFRFNKDSITNHSVQLDPRGSLNIWNGIIKQNGRLINMVDLNKITSYLDNYNY